MKKVTLQDAYYKATTIKTDLSVKSDDNQIYMINWMYLCACQKQKDHQTRSRHRLYSHLDLQLML